MTARCYVLSLLKSYQQTRIRIEILQYELKCPTASDPDEVIAAMSLRSPGTQEQVASSGISDPAASIAARLPGQLEALEIETEQNRNHICESSREQYRPLHGWSIT